MWPFHADTTPYPPLKLHKDGRIKDRNGTTFAPFPGVSELLSDLQKDGYLLAAVSRYSNLICLLTLPLGVGVIT